LSTTSCTDIKYKNSQPNEVDLLSEFPEQFRGTYLNSDGDTLQIGDVWFRYGNDKTSPMYTRKELRKGNVELKKFKKYYVLSLKERELWNIIPFSYKKEKLFVYGIDAEHKKEADIVKDDIEEITKVERKLKSDGKVDKYVIDPTSKEFEDMLDKVYPKIMDFKKID
jgi:hypothetical protein